MEKNGIECIHNITHDFFQENSFMLFLFEQLIQDIKFIQKENLI